MTDTDEQPEPSDAETRPTPGQVVRGLWSDRPMMFPNAYVWLLLFSAMDVMLTWVVLQLGGAEINGLADWFISRYGLTGMTIYKFSLVVIFVVLCEIVGRLRTSSGRMLSRVGVLIAVFPVVWTLVLLAYRL